MTRKGAQDASKNAKTHVITDLELPTRPPVPTLEMWIIEGLFGQDQDPASPSAELSEHYTTKLYPFSLVSFSGQKLLKPGNTYGLGRRDKPLIIANKKISTEHCVFTVGAFSIEDVVSVST